uniref:Uncharacterized protein n=1 Tax=Meloidogyne enterolobii TaxID=390850 RepID=A0A6V7VHB3_MELEN|nr:unnamed protein product [Meloidogyne enterolobii]
MILENLFPPFRVFLNILSHFYQILHNFPKILTFYRHTKPLAILEYFLNFPTFL